MMLCSECARAARHTTWRRYPNTAADKADLCFQDFRTWKHWKQDRAVRGCAARQTATHHSSARRVAAFVQDATARTRVLSRSAPA
jgi:hypothetical protein